MSSRSRNRTAFAPTLAVSSAPARGDGRLPVGHHFDCSRRDQIREVVRLETALGEHLAETVTDSALRKRIAAATINVSAIEAFFLNHPRARSAEDEQVWLEAAEHWLAIHLIDLRGLEYEARVLGFL